MARLSTIVVTLWCLGVAIPSIADVAATRDTRYLDAMPEPAQVLRDYSNPDPNMASAMQYSALLALSRAIDARLSKDRLEHSRYPDRPETLAERTKQGAYLSALTQVREKRTEVCKTRGCDENRYKELMTKYGNDNFHRAVVERYLKGALLDEHDQILAGRNRDLTAYAEESSKQEREKRRKEAERTGKPRPWGEILSDLRARTPSWSDWFLSGLNHPDPGVRWIALGLLVIVAGIPILGLSAIFLPKPRRVFAGVLGLLGRFLGGAWLLSHLVSCGLWAVQAAKLHPVLVAISFICALIALGGSYEFSSNSALEQGSYKRLIQAVATFVFGLMAWILFGLANLV